MPASSQFLAEVGGSKRDSWEVPSECSKYVLEEPSVPRRELIDYELCGRANASNTFRDLRSAATARRRDRSDREKYYHYRAITRGLLSRVHSRYDPVKPDPDFGPPTMIRISSWNCKMDPVTKETLYRKALQFPRPPTYHSSRKKFDSSCSLVLGVERKCGQSLLKRATMEAEDDGFQYCVTSGGWISIEEPQSVGCLNRDAEVAADSDHRSCRGKHRASIW
nr:hypothetical protein CFP56_59619 [Quercus suber]